MGSVYRPTYKGRDGKTRQSRVYRISYKDEHGKWQNVAGFRDKKASLEKLRQLEIRADRIQAGLPVEGQGSEPGKGVEEALSAWLDELRRLGRTAKYVAENERTVRVAAAACRWKSLRDIRPDSLGAYLSHLAGAGRATHTVNHARDKVAFFCNFCVRQGWFVESPVRRVKRSAVKVRPKRRRAFTHDELVRLFAVAGRYRTLLTVAALSGLRRRELWLLEKRDVVWHPSPRFHLREEATKARRADRVPMLPECAEAIRPAWNLAPAPTTRLFAGLRCTPATFDRLLSLAGITKRGDDGREVNFHSLRLTFCTLTAKRLPIHFVQKLMRHADIKMTVGTYLDLGIGDIADAIDALPRILAAESAATNPFNPGAKDAG